MDDQVIQQNPLPPSQDSSPHLDLFGDLKLRIEAILFSAEVALEVTEIRNFLGEVSLSEVRLAIKELARDYENRAFTISEFGGKYQLRTRESYAELVRKQFMSKPKSLSKSALETLAIVAYRQPVTRAEVNAIRNVDSSSIMQSLKERDLITVSGTRKELGSPLEFRTTPKFLEVFGLASLTDLPSLRSLQMTAEDKHEVTQALDSLKAEEVVPTSQELSFPDEMGGNQAAEVDELASPPVVEEPASEFQERLGAVAAEAEFVDEDAWDEPPPAVEALVEPEAPAVEE